LIDIKATCRTEDIRTTACRGQPRRPRCPPSDHSCNKQQPFI